MATSKLPLKALTLKQCTDKHERDRLILFLNKLIMNRKNVKELMDANGVRVLFMLRSEVLKFYREVLKTIRKVENKTDRADMNAWARHDFKMNKNITDQETIKTRIIQGRIQLKELSKSLNLAR